MQYAGAVEHEARLARVRRQTPNIVFADCPDLDGRAEAAAAAIFFNQGEMCTAGSRLLVEAPIKDAFLEKVAARSGACGPAIRSIRRRGWARSSTRSRWSACSATSNRASAEGARARAGGERARAESGGYFVEPTVFDGVSPRCASRTRRSSARCWRPITFERRGRGGRHRQRASSTAWPRPCGRATSRTAHRVARALRAGTVYVNCYDADDITVPFGGFKQSGKGRDKSLHAFDKYTELKTTWIDLSHLIACNGRSGPAVPGQAPDRVQPAVFSEP